MSGYNVYWNGNSLNNDSVTVALTNNFPVYPSWTWYYDSNYYYYYYCNHCSKFYSLGHCCQCGCSCKPSEEKDMEVRVYQVICPTCGRVNWLKLNEEKRCKCKILLKAVPKPKEQPIEVVVGDED